MECAGGEGLPRPPGVGEQQVFSMTVVFSQEKTEGWEAHPLKLPNVFGIVNRPGNAVVSAARATEAAMSAASPARIAIVDAFFWVRSEARKPGRTQRGDDCGGAIYMHSQDPHAHARSGRGWRRTGSNGSN